MMIYSHQRIGPNSERPLVSNEIFLMIFHTSEVTPKKIGIGCFNTVIQKQFLNVYNESCINYILNEQIGVKHCHFLYFMYQLHLISH